MEEVNNQNLWIFEIGSQKNMKVPLRIINEFRQQDRQDSQKLNNGTFWRSPFSSCQSIIGTEKQPDSGILLNSDDDDSSQAYGQIKEAFRALTKDDILQPCKSVHDFRSSKVTAGDGGYNLNGFEMRYQQNFKASQPVKQEFNFDGCVPNDING